MCDNYVVNNYTVKFKNSNEVSVDAHSYVEALQIAIQNLVVECNTCYDNEMIKS
jgi:hypothetical protein